MRRLLSILLLLSCATASSGQSGADQSSEIRNAHGSENQQPDENPRPVVPIAVQIVGNPDNRDRNEARERLTDQHEAETLKVQERAAVAAEGQEKAAWLGLFITALGSLLLLWTLCETRKSAGYTREALKIAKKSARMDLRAYVSAELQHIEPDSPEGLPGHVVVKVTNHGRTPALQCAVAFRAAWLHHPAREAPDISEHLSDKGVLHPEQVVVAVVPPIENYTMDDLSKFQKLEYKLYVFGIIRYADFTGQHCETLFCSYMGAKNGNQVSFYAAGIHNSAT